MNGCINTNILNILELITLSNVKDITDVFLKVVTMMGLIRGMFYLKTLKEKTSAATFSFWSQFRVRIFELSKWLCDDYELLDNLYETSTRRTWEGALSSKKDRKEEFKKKIEELIIFLKSAPDQMPAYIGWTRDYYTLLEFLNDVVQYDICNKDDCFKFSGEISLKQRNEYCENIRKTIDRLCKEIEEKQIQTEKKLLK